jgi:hypothetical protein
LLKLASELLGPPLGFLLERFLLFAKRLGRNRRAVKSLPETGERDCERNLSPGLIENTYAQSDALLEGIKNLISDCCLCDAAVGITNLVAPCRRLVLVDSETHPLWEKKRHRRHEANDLSARLRAALGVVNGYRKRWLTLL